MLFWKNKQTALDRKRIEALYEIVAMELDNEQVKSGLWAQATAEADGDNEKIKARYIKLRVQSLEDLGPDPALLEALEQIPDDISVLPKDLREYFDSEQHAGLFLIRPKYQQKGYIKHIRSAKTKAEKEKRIRHLNLEMQTPKTYFGQKLN
jgi:hypothetical protein